MVFARCKTCDLNFKSQIWPTDFVAVPREGEYVASKAGIRLKVTRVTHIEGQTEPYVEIELTNE